MDVSGRRTPGRPDAGEIADQDVYLAAFQIDALLTAATIAVRVGDNGAVAKARRVLDGVLGPG